MPDVITASEGYALRFRGNVGKYLLGVQDETLTKAFEAEPALPQGSLVLDHAGTHGQLGPLLGRLGYRRQVSASRKELADRAFPPSVIACGPLDGLDLPSRSFDAVVSVRLLAHAANTRAVVKEMCRLAKHSVIVDYPTKRSMNAFSSLLFHVKLGIEKDTRRFVSISDSELKAVFAEEGFELRVLERQFFIPMALHRASGGLIVVQWLEKLARRLGLVKLIGNPAVARFDRVRD